MAGRRKRTSADSQLPALPYLREVSLRTDQPVPFNEYPFRIPAAKNLERRMSPSLSARTARGNQRSWKQSQWPWA